MAFDYCNKNDTYQWLAGLDKSDLPSTIDLLIENAYIPYAKNEVNTYCGENFDLTTITEYCNGSNTNILQLSHRPISFVRRVAIRTVISSPYVEFKRWFHINEVDQFGKTIAYRGGVNPTETDSIPPYLFLDGSNVPEDLQTSVGGDVTGEFLNTTAQFQSSDLLIDCRGGKLIIPPGVLYLQDLPVPFWNYGFMPNQANVEVSYDYGYKDIDSLPKEIRIATAQIASCLVLMNKGQHLSGGFSSLSLSNMNGNFGEMPYASQIKNYLQMAKSTLNKYKRIVVH